MADTSDWTALLNTALCHALSYRQSLATRPVAASASTDAMSDLLAELHDMPAEGLPATRVLDELVQLAAPGLTAMSGPRFFGWVTGGTLPAALAADWMTSIWDQNAGPIGGAPAASAFELTALRWVAELLGLPPSVRGALVTGATLANFSALAAARNHVLGSVGWDVEQDGLRQAPEVRILVGQERHETIDKALRLLGFGKGAMRCVDADSQGRMLAPALRRELERSAGPVIVCAQAGNVNSGAFDPLPLLHQALLEYRATHGPDSSWLHLDGAFGLWARAAGSTAELASGVELCDSWATDAHKFLNVPYDSGIVLSRHPRAHRRAMAVHGAYLSSGSSTLQPTPGAFSPELSRRARGFALWAALRQLGRRGLAELVSKCVQQAQLLAAELEKTPGLRVLNDVVFNQVVLRAEPTEASNAADFARDFALAIQREGTCYATPTNWRGSPALRFSVINADTSVEDILLSARAVGRVYTSLCQ